MNSLTWLKRIATGVVVGVVATAGMAWWIELSPYLASRPGRSTAHVFRDSATDNCFKVEDDRRFGRWIFAVQPATLGDLQSLTTIDRPEWVPREYRPDESWLETHVGWPCLSFKSGFHNPARARMGAKSFQLARLSLHISGETYSVPVAPVWPGFVADVALYSIAYVGIASAVAALRRRRRVGCCPKCLYSMKGLAEGAVCPECGAAREGAAA